MCGGGSRMECAHTQHNTCQTEWLLHWLERLRPSPAPPRPPRQKHDNGLGAGTPPPPKGFQASRGRTSAECWHSDAPQAAHLHSAKPPTSCRPATKRRPLRRLAPHYSHRQPIRSTDTAICLLLLHVSASAARRRVTDRQTAAVAWEDRRLLCV